MKCPSKEDVRVAVTLANIAYLDEGEPGHQATAMRKALENGRLPTSGVWHGVR